MSSKHAKWVALVGLGLLSTSVLSAGGRGQGLPGGRSDRGEKPLRGPQLDQFERGRELFDRAFHRSEGLGTPEMNADSCRGCHQDPSIGGAGGLELNVSRFGFDDGGAGPFMNLPGGQGLSKLRPPYVEGREEYDPAQADVFEQRQTPSIFGAGHVDLIFASQIIANADPDDLDGDGIRGVPRLIDTGGPGMEVGRFGWKAQVPRLEDFIRDAMGGELGITTPDDGRGFALVADGDEVPDPELSPEQLGDMLFFMQRLDPPQRGGSTDPRVAEGEQIFEMIGCAKCHVPALNSKVGPVRLFSNLLLHDVMGPGFRGMAEPGAEAGMFKTPPLWGIRDTAPYMHDGRGETIPDTILLHAGEAENVRMAYEALLPAEQEALHLFLLDL